MCSKLIELQPSAQRFKELPRSLNANRSHPPPCLDPVRDLDLTHLAMRTGSALPDRPWGTGSYSGASPGPETTGLRLLLLIAIFIPSEKENKNKNKN